jgi:hypothetical protein
MHASEERHCTHQHRGDRRLARMRVRVAGRRGNVGLQRINHALRGEGRRHGNQGRVHVVLRDQRGQGVRAVVGPCMIHIMGWMRHIGSQCGVAWPVTVLVLYLRCMRSACGWWGLRARTIRRRGRAGGRGTTRRGPGSAGARTPRRSGGQWRRRGAARAQQQQQPRQACAGGAGPKGLAGLRGVGGEGGPHTPCQK